MAGAKPCALVLLRDELPLPATELAPRLAKAIRRTRIDVIGALKRNPYIPMEDLSEDEAAAAVDCLRSAGGEAAALFVGQLPAAARVFRVTSADATDDGLHVQTNLAGRMQVLPWADLEAISAAVVSETSVPLGLSARSVRDEIEEMRQAARAMDGRFAPGTSADVDIPAPQPRTETYPALCLMPAGADLEMRIRGDMFNYGYLGPRLRHVSDENFRLLIGDILARATRALVDRPVRRLSGSGESPPSLEIHMLARRNRWLRLLAREGLAPPER